MEPRNARQSHASVRHHLWELYNRGALRADPDAEETAFEVLKSGEDDLVAEFFHWLQPQDFIYQQQEQHNPRLFHEPGQRELHGEIYVGDTPEKKHRATVALSCFEKGHMEIDGPTGSGKSTFANTIVPQIARHVPVTVIDALNQHAPAMPSNFLILFFEDYEINPLRAPSGVDQLVYVRKLADWLEGLYEFPAVAKMIFVKKCADVIAAGKQLSVPVLIKEFDRSDSSGGAILKRLEELPEQFHASVGMDPKKLFSKPLYLGVQSANKAAQKFLLYHLFLYFTLLHPAPVKYRLRHAFLVHESRAFIRKDEATPFLGEVFRQIRNHGLASIWLEQDPSGVKDEIRANITNRVVFPETMLGSIARSFGLDKEQEEFIRAAPKRTVVVKRSDIPYPFVVRVPEFDYSHVVGPQEIQERRRQTVEFLRGPQPVKSTGQKALADLLSDPDLLRLLHHIEAKPDCPTTRRYKELGFRSVKKADQLRRRLIELGLVEEIRIKTGTQGGWYNTLRLTSTGKSPKNQEPGAGIKRESNA